jgi:hypothetical protein
MVAGVAGATHPFDVSQGAARVTVAPALATPLGAQRVVGGNNNFKATRAAAHTQQVEHEAKHTLAEQVLDMRSMRMWYEGAGRSWLCMRPAPAHSPPLGMLPALQGTTSSCCCYSRNPRHTATASWAAYVVSPLFCVEQTTPHDCQPPTPHPRCNSLS